jgi:hypothetical protein
MHLHLLRLFRSRFRVVLVGEDDVVLGTMIMRLLLLLLVLVVLLLVVVRADVLKL